MSLSWRNMKGENHEVSEKTHFGSCVLFSTG